MKIKRSKLLSILEKVKPGIAPKELIESMTYFLFSGTNIITYNDVISIQHPFKTDFNLFVKANDLYKILSKTGIENLIITEKNDKLSIESKKFKANLNTIQDDEINDRINTITKSLKQTKWKDLPSNFCSNISLCAFTASNLESEGTLTCVYINGFDCISSDNARISHIKLSSKIDDTMFIKASEIKNLIAIDPIKYAITKSWMHFKSEDNCIFSIRKMNGEYPDFLQFFDFEGTSVNLPKEIMEGLDIAAILMDDTAPVVNLKIKKNCCFISVDSVGGTVKYRTKIDYDGDEINFIINPIFLQEMMGYESFIILNKNRIKIQTEKGFALLIALFV